MEKIVERVMEIIEETVEQPGTIEYLKDNDDLTKLGIDSITFIKILVLVEDEFNVEFEDENLDFTKFTSKEFFCNTIYSKISTTGE